MAQLVKLPSENEEVTGSNPDQDNFVIYYNYCLIYPFQFWMVAAMDGCIQCNCKRHPWLHPLTFDKILRPRLTFEDPLAQASKLPLGKLDGLQLYRCLLSWSGEQRAIAYVQPHYHLNPSTLIRTGSVSTARATRLLRSCT